MHSATRASRKSALCSWRFTENRILQPFLDHGVTKKCILPSRLTEKRTLHPFLDRGGTKRRILQPAPHQKPHSAPALPPSTWYRAALASLIAKGVVLKAPVLVDAIAVDLVLGYAYAARVEDRDARVRMPIGVRLEHPLVRVSVHKGCPRR